MTTLFDILVRHQIYLEGLKKGRTSDFPTMLAKLDQALRQNLAHVDYDTLGDVSKRKLNEILVALRKAMRSIFDPWINELVVWLQRYMQVEVGMFNEYFTSDLDADRTFAETKSEPMAANGLFWLPFLKGSTTYMMVRIERLVTTGYANRLTKEQIVRSLIGTKAKGYKDGIGKQLDRANAAAIATVMQHLSAQASANAARKVFDKYEWVSVLDDNTTNICRDRDGKIYVYGRGPMPPAHVGCRSITVPSNAAPTKDLRFNMWAREQSAEFVNDAFDGTAPARYEGSAALTLSQFQGKQSIILS